MEEIENNERILPKINQAFFPRYFLIDSDQVKIAQGFHEKSSISSKICLQLQTSLSKINQGEKNSLQYSQYYEDI